MADDKTKTGGQDRKRINVNEDYDQPQRIPVY